jgi:hypothetical protein
MEWKKDIWRPMVVGASVDTIIRRGSLDGLPCHWLPAAPALQFSADPFGIWRNGLLHVFVETFDYRSAHGAIAVHVLDASLRVLETREVLREPWHVSYPLLVEHDGATWMIPETSASGGQWLYRARAFPFEWERVGRIDLPALDATPQWIGDRWWMFYSPPAPPRTAHPSSCRLGPRPDRSVDTPPGQSAADRPARGAPGRTGGTYRRPDRAAGAGLHALLWLRDPLADHRAHRRNRTGRQRTGPAAPAAAAPFLDGLHTLSGAGPVTLIDVKQRLFSAPALFMRPRRELARILARMSPNRLK